MQSVTYIPERLRVQRSINACLKAVVHAHGQRRTPADKRKAVTTLLTNSEVANDPDTGEPWSDRAIARWCKVGNKFVGDVRRSLTVSEHSEPPPPRWCAVADGGPNGARPG